MNKHHPHNNIIERKLDQLPVADADQLWNDMHAILDKKMPQKKERRRFIVWLLSGEGLFLLTAIFLITGPTLYFLTKKESATVTINKLTGSAQSNKFIEEDAAKVSAESKENTNTASTPDQITNNKPSATITKDNISATIALRTPGETVVNNSFLTLQTIKQAKKYTAQDQLNPSILEFRNYTGKDEFNQPIQEISKSTANFDIASVNLKSIYQDFLLTANHNDKEDTLRQQPGPVANKVKTNAGNNNQSGFYTGIISGVDLSSIRFQSVKTGATMGLIIGYAINKKWSVESGLLWDTKRVFDNGTYFDPPGYAPINGITIVAVNGKSRLYEWPVNMKYTIISGKHSVFTTAGLSSYLMRSENYNYEYLQNNQPGGHNYLSYKNETKNWFSVANFSMGYTHKLGSNGSIRVEPYLKLPLKNLGVGNMPIMSTGLNIGFTKPLR